MHIGISYVASAPIKLFFGVLYLHLSQRLGYNAARPSPRQEVPEENKDGPGGPWQFVDLLPLFDPPRHDSAETIRRALNLGVNVKMITGDQLAIAKETGRRLGMGTNRHPSSSLLGSGHDKDPSIAGLPVDELIKKADGFAGVFPEHKYEILKKLQKGSTYAE